MDRKEDVEYDVEFMIGGVRVSKVKVVVQPVASIFGPHMLKPAALIRLPFALGAFNGSGYTTSE